MDFLNANIGSAKDNARSPIHNWYKFTAGFSHIFVDELIRAERMESRKSSVFDPFAGCGTTLVSCQKNGVGAVGNESQRFMRDIIRAKLNWRISETKFKHHLENIKTYSSGELELRNISSTVHSLLVGLYDERILSVLARIRDYIATIKSEKYRLFFNLALSQTLHKVSIYPIAVPYISRNKTLKGNGNAWDTFEKIANQMQFDTRNFCTFKSSSKVYLHDSRIPNRFIENGSLTNCITSPPYLNNLDYGEVSKVHTHFFHITKSWNDITEKVRKNLVTGSTTHYKESEFSLTDYQNSDFFTTNKAIGKTLLKAASQIKGISETRAGHKSFDILTLLYFRDMYSVLCEIKRIVKSGGKSYLILGDSAPYGVYIPTTELLGKLAKGAGFNRYEIHKIRSRGTKWKTLTHRHSIELSENVLVLQ